MFVAASPVIFQIADSSEDDLPNLLASPPPDLPDPVAEVLAHIRQQL